MIHGIRKNINLGSNLSYYKVEGGEKALLTFHGFGQKAEDFEPFNGLKNSGYTLYHFDLPFHGKSDWHTTPILIEQIQAYFNTFLVDEEIRSFEVAAFSLGGKMLIALLKLYPTKINSVYLIAPDGIRTNIWYKLATGVSLFKYIFKWIISHPNVYFKLTRILHKIGILDKSMIKFVQSQMDTSEMRQEVYTVWNGFSKLAIPMTNTVNIINVNSIKVHLYLGKYDRVIPVKKFRRFLDAINNMQPVILEAGHNSMIKKAASRIINDLNHQ
ncbi:MAG: alpha/beta hydrolase [Cyclobacteriaceae bacterium]